MRYFAVVFAATLLLPFGSFSQNQTNSPNFSGTWKMDATRSESAHQDQPIELVTLIINQTPSELSIEKRSGQKSETTSYQFSDPNGPRPPGRGGARWNGNKLILDAVRSVDGEAVTSAETLSLNAKGDELEVNTTVTIQHGYEGNDKRNPTTSGPGKDIYIKK